MAEILTYLPILAVLIISNILLGTFYNVSVKEIQFDKTVLLDGIKKAVSIAIAFIALALTFDKVSIGGDLLTPDNIMITSIIAYTAKVTANLTKILGVNQSGE